METVNHECYVSLEVAKLLKEVGFNWDTYSAYNKDGVFADKNRSITTWNDFADYYSAPTLEIAQKWLREIKGIEVFVEPFVGFYKYMVEELKEDGIYDYGRSGSYEESLEAGIKKALEIILEKGK